MKKIIFYLVIVLLFSCTSIQAKMSMRIISRNIRSHEEKAVADIEEKKEAAKSAEVEEAKEEVEVTEATKAVEVTEAIEVTEAADVDAVAGTTEIKEIPGAAEVTETTEAVGAIEATDVKDVKDVKEVEEVTEATEATEVAEAVEVTETVGVTEVVDEAGAVEVTETVEATQAKMPMRIISRYKRLYEEKAVADNEEKKETTKPAEVEDAKEEVEVTEATMEVEATETSKVTEATEPTEAEAVEAVKVEVVEETIEVIDVAEAKKEVEVTEVTTAVGVTEAAKAVEVTVVSDATEVAEVVGATETKEVLKTIEVTKRVKVPENSEATEVTEAIKPVEVKELTETGPVDYEALGLRSVELNPNDYPDEVIALLEPHKNNKNNNSVLFYSSLGLAYKSKGRLKAAIAAYKRALKLVPNVPAPSIQYNLGIAYYYNNELHKSFSCFLNSSAQRPDHLGTEKWIKQLADELDIYKVPNTSKLKLVVNQKISVNRKKDDRESRIRMYLTQDGGRIQELSVAGKIYSYGIDSDTKRPVDYIIIDNDGDGSFDNVINTKGKFGVPTWAYNPE